MPKNKTLVELLSARTAARFAGKTVVHCHGCFDIVHPGHIKHLQYAKSLGDVLVVSISADSHVNKGVARPLIPDDLRAASVAALECVDLVYINPEPTAVGLLEQLQPDVYVKGKEYETNSDPRFLRERDTVTGHGGRVVFSSGDVVYSSTALIGTLGGAEVFNDEKILRLRDRYELGDANLHNLVQRFRGQKVVVIGDYILDRYHFCDATGIASEGPMMTLRALQQKDYDGGAAVIALHLAGLGANPTLITAMADDETSRQIGLRLAGEGVDVRSLNVRKSIVAKHRFLVEAQKMFKVDDGGPSPLDSVNEAALAETILSAAEGAAAVIFADFGYGLISAGLLDRVLETLRATVRTIAADVSGKQTNLLKFRDVDLVCPTEREVRETLQDFTSGLGAVVWNLMNSTGVRQALITMGKQGLVTFDHPDSDNVAVDARLRSEYVPALAAHTVDPLGCGDALLATATLTLAVGGSLQAAALLGSVAAAIEVGSIGNRPIDAEALLGRLSHRAQHSEAA
ncbi:MAG TPA: PfkB family carbohydrate kinase [Tepidisphaeraceae bacterium]|nr:PfkB family carbohydrate kinase [Tepidisphaeraceae bacterium]